MDLACDIFGEPWSPCTFEDGYRAKRFFQTADVVALDFDGGTTLSDAVIQARRSGYIFAIATTKSHKKEKVTKSGVVVPPMDRFRLIIPTARQITNMDEYEWVMSCAIRTFRGADDACKDAARFFFPSTRLSCWCGDGVPYSWPAMPPKVAVKVSLPKVPHKLSDRMLQLLRIGSPEGTRHKTLVKVCFYLGAQGIPREQAWQMVLSSGFSLPEKDKQQVFKSMWEKGYINGSPS